MPIDEQTIAGLRALRKQWSTAHERDLERLSDTFIPAVLKALPALLTAASNEAIVTAERDFWRSETQRETEKSQGLQRLYDAQQDLIEDQARKLHAAQMEAEALRARDAGWALENEELKSEVSKLDAVVHELGIEGTDEIPAEAVTRLITAYEYQIAQVAEMKGTLRRLGITTFSDDMAASTLTPPAPALGRSKGAGVMTRYLCHEFVGGTGSPWSQAPDGLYVVRSGVATAVTAEQMSAAATKTHAFCCVPGPNTFQKLIAALTQAQGGAE